MELTTKTHNWPRSTPHLQYPKLPIKFWLVFSIFITNLGLIVGVAILTKHDEAPMNPLSAYTDLPGASVSELIAQGFLCEIHAPTCTLRLDSGVFSSIEVLISNNRVSSIGFTVRSGALNVGDLALLWGRPQILWYRRGGSLEWPETGISATVLSKNHLFDYFLPIHCISFRGE